MGYEHSSTEENLSDNARQKIDAAYSFLLKRLQERHSEYELEDIKTALDWHLDKRVEARGPALKGKKIMELTSGHEDFADTVSEFFDLEHSDSLRLSLEQLDILTEAMVIQDPTKYGELKVRLEKRYL